MAHEGVMGWLRRIPLFVPIAAMWWLALFGYPPTRPLLFDSLGWKGPEPVSQFRGALSIVHVLTASWIAVRLLTRFRAGRDMRSAVLGTLAVVWFAFTTGSCLIVFVSVLDHHLSANGSPLMFIWLPFVVFPFFALIAFGVTWIVWVLALATVLIVRRASGARERSASEPLPSGT
jgi:hypothetical protein